MAGGPKKGHIKQKPDDIDVTPRQPADFDGEPKDLQPVADTSERLTKLQEMSKETSIRTREIDIARITEEDKISDDIMASLKKTDWSKVSPKDQAIIFGILQDKRAKALTAVDPVRFGGQKARKTTFEFKIERGTVKATVEQPGGGDDE